MFINIQSLSKTNYTLNIKHIISFYSTEIDTYFVILNTNIVVDNKIQVSDETFSYLQKALNHCNFCGGLRIEHEFKHRDHLFSSMKNGKLEVENK